MSELKELKRLSMSVIIFICMITFSTSQSECPATKCIYGPLSEFNASNLDVSCKCCSDFPSINDEAVLLACIKDSNTKTINQQINLVDSTITCTCDCKSCGPISIPTANGSPDCCQCLAENPDPTKYCNNGGTYLPDDVSKGCCECPTDDTLCDSSNKIQQPLNSEGKCECICKTDTSQIICGTDALPDTSAASCCVCNTCSSELFEQKTYELDQTCQCTCKTDLDTTTPCDDPINQNHGTAAEECKCICKNISERNCGTGAEPETAVGSTNCCKCKPCSAEFTSQTDWNKDLTGCVCECNKTDADCPFGKIDKSTCTCVITECDPSKCGPNGKPKTNPIYPDCCMCDRSKSCGPFSEFNKNSNWPECCKCKDELNCGSGIATGVWPTCCKCEDVTNNNCGSNSSPISGGVYPKCCECKPETNTDCGPVGVYSGVSPGCCKCDDTKDCGPNGQHVFSGSYPKCCECVKDSDVKCPNGGFPGGIYPNCCICKQQSDRDCGPNQVFTNDLSQCCKCKEKCKNGIDIPTPWKTDGTGCKCCDDSDSTTQCGYYGIPYGNPDEGCKCKCLNDRCSNDPKSPYYGSAPTEWKSDGSGCRCCSKYSCYGKGVVALLNGVYPNCCSYSCSSICPKETDPIGTYPYCSCRCRYSDLASISNNFKCCRGRDVHGNKTCNLPKIRLPHPDCRCQ